MVPDNQEDGWRMDQQKRIQGQKATTRSHTSDNLILHLSEPLKSVSASLQWSTPNVLTSVNDWCFQNKGSKKLTRASTRTKSLKRLSA